MQIFSTVGQSVSGELQFSQSWIPTLFLLFLAFSNFSGCLSDPIGGHLTLYRGILRPQGVSRRDTLVGGTPSLVVRWEPTTSDTQLNFRGYEVALFLADSGTGQALGSDTIRPPTPMSPTLVYDSAIVAKGTAAYINRTFVFPTSPSKALQTRQQYIAAVWALRYSDPAKPDSLVRSFDSAGVTFFYDPRPVNHPNFVQAVAAGPEQVNIHWALPPSDTQSNLLGYTVYYRRTFPPVDTGRIGAAVGPHQDSVTVTVPPGPNGASTPPFEASYIFYVAAVRADSLIDSASVGAGAISTDTVTWSGAEQFTNYFNTDPDSTARGFLALPPGYGVFIGALNGFYSMASFSDDSTSSPVNVVVRISGDQVTLTGKNGAQFAATGDFANDLLHSYYSRPVTAYPNASFSLPLTGTVSKIYNVHVRFSDGTHARIAFRTQGNGKFIAPNGGVEVQATFQPVSLLPYD